MIRSVISKVQVIKTACFLIGKEEIISVTSGGEICFQAQFFAVLHFDV